MTESSPTGASAGDRPRGWLEMLRPLRRRDFALLWTGGTVSMIGDGIYTVAIAWQVYDLSNVPTALSVVGAAWALGLVGFLLVGGVLADRIDRRRVIIGSDLARFAVLVVMGALSIAGVLDLWMVIVLALLFGCAEAFFGPAWTAIVPDIVPEEELIGANALENTIQPVALRLLGPVLGGAIIATLGSGAGLLIDAATFLVSAACVWALRVRPAPKEDAAPSSMRADLREAAAFVRANTWLWATLIAVSIAILAFWGPEEVLVPFIVRNDLGGTAGDFGIVLAGVGVGSMAGSFVMSRIGLPRRPVTFMFLVWGVATLPMIGYVGVNALWQSVLISLVFGAMMAMGMVVWTTLMQSRVPVHMRGRVSSLDWFASLALVPLSFAITGPISALFGPTETLVGGAIASSLPILAMLFLVPGLRAEDARLRATADAEPGGQAGAGSADASPASAPPTPVPPFDELAAGAGVASGASSSTGGGSPTDA